ncbi:hypothetical protein GGU11DRAFT_751149 [Lentinula aff. detonsa]|nr:hypothetical protein GGU11DRAFT_751149 [Lentinula aff. detonsa]
MSSPNPNNNTTQQQAARQEAEFAAEMDRLKEEAAREAEDRRIAEEKRLAEERRMEEERLREEEKRLAEKKIAAEEEKKKQDALAEKKRNENLRLAEAKRREEEAAAAAEDNHKRSTAYKKLVEDNKKEKERAAKELQKQQKSIPAANSRQVDVIIPPRPSGSKKIPFKSKSIISDESDEESREVVPAPRGETRKQTVKMIPKGGVISNADSEYDPEFEHDNERSPDDPSPSCPACSRCIMIGRPSECRPQSLQRQAQACAICHWQWQQCSWSGDNTARRSRAKRVKLDDEMYEGPAARVGERRLEGPGIAEQLATIAKHNEELVNITRCSLVLQQRMLHLMVRRERRELEAVEEEKDDKDEDKDGEGEEDEEEVKETKRKEEDRASEEGMKWLKLPMNGPRASKYNRSSRSSDRSSVGTIEVPWEQSKSEWTGWYGSHVGVK